MILLVCLPGSGCVIVETGVTNPIPGLTTVAVAPFFNLSQERAVDGRRFALAYFTELQKVPGFEVVPLGVVEQAIFDHRLEMNNPEDALKLAEILGVDAVVVGAVTDYDPYYPPRIGLKVSWYSPHPWEFYPGIPTDPGAINRWREEFYKKRHRARLQQRAHRQKHRIFEQHGQPLPGDPFCPTGDCVIRGQSVSHSQGRVQANSPEIRTVDYQETASLSASTEEKTIPHFGELTESPVSLPELEQGASMRHVEPEESAQDIPLLFPEADPLDVRPVAGPPFADEPPPLDEPPLDPQLPPLPWEPYEPLMSYTRIFDGADAHLVANLRDFLELSGDQRSGGWEGYLQRSEDFIRFTAHLMIKEMLTLHGGEGQRRFVFKLRKYR